VAKLWSKGKETDALIEEFTVGTDYVLDRHLIAADVAGSMAHARMLASIKLLAEEELHCLEKGLRQILQEDAEGRVEITRGDEDCHTVIENRLTELCGDAGKKIHTGRSRNDQVLTALRLYVREAFLASGSALAALVDTLLQFSRTHEFVPMPGRTHMQIAMPSSVGLWAAAFAEEFADLGHSLKALYPLLNRSPLGSAASYGVPLPINREMTAALLGFSGPQNNVLYVNNSRGKLESLFLDLLEQVALTLSRLAEDLILFSLPEFGYFGLPEALCTGSSIMPQKKNPDVLELMRGKSATVSSCARQVKDILRSLPSGYNRDTQETKEPLFRGIQSALGMIRVAAHTVGEVTVNRRRLEDACVPELYATDHALELVKKGVPFRDAYKKAAAELASLSRRDPEQALRARTATGTSGNLNLGPVTSAASELVTFFDTEAKRVRAAVADLLGKEVSLYR